MDNLGENPFLCAQAGAFMYAAVNESSKHLECWLVMFPALMTKLVIWISMVSPGQRA